jgi:hypothetical protein
MFLKRKTLRGTELYSRNEEGRNPNRILLKAYFQ